MATVLIGSLASDCEAATVKCHATRSVFVPEASPLAEQPLQGFLRLLDSPVRDDVDLSSEVQGTSPRSEANL